jgi:hypothetical protein
MTTENYDRKKIKIKTIKSNVGKVKFNGHDFLVHLSKPWLQSNNLNPIITIKKT